MIRVRPFARALDRRESEYLFGDLRGPWAGEELSQALARASQKHLGVRLTASGWRHVAIGIATRHLIRASKTWEKEYEEPAEGEEEFAEGDDAEELEMDAYRHMIVRYVGAELLTGVGKATQGVIWQTAELLTGVGKATQGVMWQAAELLTGVDKDPATVFSL